MSNILAVELLPLGAQTVSGSGSAVDITALRTTLDLVVCVDAVSGTTPTLAVDIETAVSASGPWRSVGSLTPASVTAVGRHKFLVGDCLQFVRANWVIGGTTPSFTFSVAGDAHVVYCDREDLTVYGMSSNVLDHIDGEAKLSAIIAATATSASFLSVAYTLPLAAWGSDLSRYTAIQAVVVLAGPDREGLDEALVEIFLKEAMDWLKMIGLGRLRPKTIIDATPEVEEDNAEITTTTSRGWLR